MAKLYAKNTWVDELLATNERYDISQDDGTPIYADAQIVLSSTVAQAGTAVDAARMNNIEDGLDAVDTRLNTLLDGWIDPTETWTYASATTITVPGDQTAKYTIGVKVKYTQTTVKFGYVLSSSYSAPNTTVTIIGTAVANAAITANYYSRAASPDGFPHWFDWTPTITAGGSMTISSPVITFAKFSIVGKTLTFGLRATFTTGGVADGTVLATLPFTAGSSQFAMGAMVQDGGAPVAGYAFTSTTQIAIRKYDASSFGLGASRLIAVSGSIAMA